MIAFIDLETTGLDREKDTILEVGVTLTDLEFNVLAEKDWVQYHSHEDLLKMDEWCRNTHRETGLWSVCTGATLVSWDIIDREIVQFIEEHGGFSGIMLAGRSVHFDRAFIRKFLPQLNDFLHYRHLDVSCVGWFLSRCNIDFALPNTAANHRALQDNHEAIEAARNMKGALKLMEKNAVVIDDEHQKTAEQQGNKVLCPICKVEADTSDNIPRCPNHGTEPWEKRP